MVTISSRDVIYNMVTIVNTACYIMYMKIKRVDVNSSHHKEKILFIFFLFLSEMMDVNLL